MALRVLSCNGVHGVIPAPDRIPCGQGVWENPHHPRENPDKIMLTPRTEQAGKNHDGAGKRTKQNRQSESLS